MSTIAPDRLVLNVLGEGDEQLVLLRRELHRLACERDHPRREVDLELANGQPRVPRPGRPAKHCTHARHQLVVDEGPHDVGFLGPQK
jgi:hypothetical protein